jgi:hypothetical protein
MLTGPLAFLAAGVWDLLAYWTVVRRRRGRSL